MGPPPTDESAATYRIGSQDLLQIEVFRVEDLSTQERVNEEGFVSMPLIGAVQVGGLTPPEAERQIGERLRRYVRDPQVNLFVTEYASQDVTVAGAVKESGVFPLKGHTTLLQAIAQAGGISELANDEEVVIFRTLSTGGTQAYVVN
ncbi:MAG: polysaccharide export protein, partial [Candidatus Competibacteraceae bacterium]|nr:polysaccharide export protein [Candidatus Competibacteraceae bacterium]